MEIAEIRGENLSGWGGSLLGSNGGYDPTQTIQIVAIRHVS